MCICVTCRGVDLASVSIILNLFLRVVFSVFHFIYMLAMMYLKAGVTYSFFPPEKLVYTQFPPGKMSIY